MSYSTTFPPCEPWAMTSAIGITNHTVTIAIAALTLASPFVNPSWHRDISVNLPLVIVSLVLPSPAESAGHTLYARNSQTRHIYSRPNPFCGWAYVSLSSREFGGRNE